MSENNFELVKRELSNDPAQGAILSRVLKDLSPAEIERLKTKAAEGKMALELEQIAKVHQFQASSADIEQFIQNVKTLEFSQRGAFSTYKAAGEFKTATGTTTIQAKKGCYIATQVYGSDSHPNVLLLRAFRDEYLEPNPFGEAFCKAYYTFAPRLAASWAARGICARLVRRLLNVICGMMNRLAERR